jgi:hypothetical protein
MCVSPFFQLIIGPQLTLSIFKRYAEALSTKASPQQYISNPQTPAPVENHWAEVWQLEHIPPHTPHSSSHITTVTPRTFKRSFGPSFLNTVFPSFAQMTGYLAPVHIRRRWAMFSPKIGKYFMSQSILNLIKQTRGFPEHVLAPLYAHDVRFTPGAALPCLETDTSLNTPFLP